MENPYTEIDGEKHISTKHLAKISDSMNQYLIKYFRGELEPKEFITLSKIGIDKIIAAMKFIDTEKEFLKECTPHPYSLEEAKREWNHELEHAQRHLEFGLKCKIGILHIIDEQKTLYIQPKALANYLDVIHNWPLEKFATSLIKSTIVSNPSDEDIKLRKFYESLLEECKRKNLTKKMR